MKTWVGLLSFVVVAGAVFAQDEAEVNMEWQEGPSLCTMSTIASVELPDGYVFTGAEGTRTIMESWGNPTTGTEIGIIAPVSNSWAAVFEFDPIGYVNEDEKDDLDADAIMESLRQGQDMANEERREAQMAELEIDGWYKEPFYNTRTKNLEWCTQLRQKGTDEPFANHNIRILGRRGITRITLVADLDQLDEAIPALAVILEGFKYQEGNRYAEYRKGDKMAKYGLTALVAGGAAAVALKSGLFKYIWKGLVIAAVALGGFFKKIFKKIFRKSR